MIPSSHRRSLLLLASLAAAVPLAAQSAPAPAPGGQSLWNLIVAGGWAMWPLGLCSIVLLFLAIHVWRETQRARFIPDDHLPRLRGYLGGRDVDAARLLLGERPTLLGRTLATALERARPDHPDAAKAKVEDSLAELLEHEENLLSTWVNYLNVVATVAPMIGLLGTVSGMIGAFQTISAGGMGRPELLAGDIGEALITTAAGLIIGIPAMVLYFLLRSRLNGLMVATTQVATQLIDTLAGDVAAPGAG